MNSTSHHLVIRSTIHSFPSRTDKQNREKKKGNESKKKRASHVENEIKREQPIFI
jgi:hypothetical protein